MSTPTIKHQSQGHAMANSGDGFGIAKLLAERDALAARVREAKEDLEQIATVVGYSQSESEAYSLAELIETLTDELESHLNLKGKHYTMRQLMTIACNLIYAGKFIRGTCAAHGDQPHTHTSNCKDWRAE